MRSRSIIVIVVFVALALLHLNHGQRRIADADEFQTLVNAFDAARGLTPYVDFWDNHGPLSIWALQSIFALWNGGHSLIQDLRALMWLNTLLVAAGTFTLARFLYSTRIATIAALVLLTSPVYISKAIEVRPDNPANLLATIALLSLAIGLKTRRSYLFLISGLSLGLLAGFTLKAAIIAAAIGLYALCWVLKTRQLPRLNNLLILMAGGLCVVAVITAVLAAGGMLMPFLDCYMGGNVNRAFAGFTSSEFTRVFEKSPVWSFTVTFALFASTLRILTRKADAAETGLTAMSLFILIQFLIFLPTKNMQSLLPLFVPLCIITSHHVNRWLAKLASRPWWTPPVAVGTSIILSLLLLRDIHAYANLKNEQLPKQVRFADIALDLTASKPEIFDPLGIVFLKPKPGPFHVLVTFIRQMHQNGTIDLKLTELLDHPDMHYMVLHKRAGDLRVNDVNYIRQNYGPIARGPDCFLLRRGRPDDGSYLSAKDLEYWNAWEWEDARHPLRNPPAPPAWYTRFLSHYEQ